MGIAKIKEKIETLHLLGYQSVVLRNFPMEVLSSIYESYPGALGILETSKTDVQWFADLRRAETLFGILSNTAESPFLLLSEHVFAILKTAAPILVNNLGRIACLSFPADFGKKKETLSAALSKIFPENYCSVKGCVRLDSRFFENYDSFEAFELPKSMEYADADSLRIDLKGRRVFYRDIPKSLVSLLKTHCDFVGQESEQPIDAMLISAPLYRKKDDWLPFYCDLQMRQSAPIPVAIFTGYIPDLSLTVGEMKEKLFNWFCFDRFLSYDARSRLGNPYRISQEELIRYLIDQSTQKKPKDLFFIAGTGSGKSLVYQYTARYLYEKYRKVTIVVSPIKALMHDQVRSMSDNLSVYLDGDLSYEERNAVHERIKNNEVCLLYISPEMLISNGIASLCPPESIGLVVIDEAHLVLEWGLSFRVDYGYLGRSIHRLRKDFLFPVFATTASAIWGGPMDSVSEISDLLYLNDPNIIYTEIRKKTDLQINRMDLSNDQKACSIRALKDEKSIASITNSVRENQKIIVYMPYATQVNQMLHTLQTTALEPKVAAYTGKSDAESRKRAFADFRSGRKPVMLATKAFGMGIDIPDVRTVYHLHVPSTLEEYLQEIGRAGRDGDPATAETDYHPSDPGFAYKLARMSMPQQWKINHLFRHILSLLKEKKGENRFVISLDDVTYLFRNTWNESENSAERKARTALFLIEKDLENKYGHPLLSLQSEKYQYVYFALRNPTDSSTVEGLPEVAVLSDNYSRPSRFTGSPIVSDSKVYQLDIPRLWERAYKDISVKKLLYMLSTDPEAVLGCGMIPLVHVAYRYRHDFRVVRNKANQLWQLISDICEALTSETKEEDLDNVIAQKLFLYPDIDSMNSAKEKVRTILLTAFTSNVNNGLLSLIHEKGDPNGQRAFKSLSNYSIKLDRFTSSIRSFLSDSPDKQTFYFPLKPYDNWKEVEVFLRILDLLGLVALEIDSGRGRSFEFYCKNRTMLANIGNNYHNDLVTLINKRMKAKYEIAKDFYEKTESSEDRWRYLEKYFFGNPVSSGSSVYEHSDRVI